MTLTRLSLTNFRSYADALITPGPGFVVLTGDNGAGKTNVLEAVSLLVPGRGLRGAPLVEMARQDGPGGFGVAAQMGDVDLGTGAQATAPERRLVRINGAAAAATALAQWLSVIWLTPAMDGLFVEGAGERRRFLDRLVLALLPGHASNAARYEAAMRQRNRLLADERPADPEWLTALEVQMAEHGAALAEARTGVVAQLNGHLVGREEGLFARAGLALEGWSTGGDLARNLRDSRARDAAARRALIGPHRTDLVVTHLGKGQAAGRCSTGEQKALMLGIILAHADAVAGQTGRRPVLLLDEVAAHLDPVRRAALFDQLAQGGGQVWITGTEAQPFGAIGPAGTWLTVENARVVPA